MTTATEPLTTPLLQVTNTRRWTIVWLLFAASLINYFDRATISFALPLISKDLNLGPEAKGVLLSAFFWSYTLLQIPMGRLADRTNLRWVYAGTFVLWSLAQGLTGFAGSLAMLIFFRVILGIGEAIYLVGGTKVVSLFFSLRERGLPCGLFDAGTRTGLVLEGLIIGWMLQTYGWRKTFAAVGFLALVWLVPWFMATPAQMRPSSSDRAQPRQRLIWNDISALLRSRDLLGVLLGFFCFDYFWYLLLTWLPSYLVEVRQLTVMKAGIYSSLPFCVFGVCQPLGGWLADHLIRRGWDPARTRKGIISAAFLSGLLIIPAAHATTPNAAVILIMSACLVGLSTANQLVLLQSCTPPEQVGLAVGVYNFVGNVAGILAPIVTGFVIKLTGSYTPAFVLAAVMLASSVLSYWFIVGPLTARTERQLTV
jgi:MFS family permease